MTRVNIVCKHKQHITDLKSTLLFEIWHSIADYPASCTNVLGPFVQSIVSLTSSLRVISLTVLVDSIYNIPIFFAEKM